MLPARLVKSVPLPADLHLQLADALAAQGITRVWTHQAECWQASRSRALHGHHRHGVGQEHVLQPAGQSTDCCVIPTPRAIYLYPPQGPGSGPIRRLRMLAARRIEVDHLRRRHPRPPAGSRQKARVLLTNPDMIHLSLLPQSRRWNDFFFNLRLRGHRRATPIGECRQQRGQRAPPPAEGRLVLRGGAALHPGASATIRKCTRARAAPDRAGGGPHHGDGPQLDPARSCSGSRPSRGSAQRQAQL